MEARGWRLEAKTKPLEDTVHGTPKIKNEKARPPVHVLRLRFKPIDLTLLNNPTTS